MIVSLSKKEVQLADNGNGQKGFNPLAIFTHIFSWLWEREDIETGDATLIDDQAVIEELEDSEDNPPNGR